VQIGFINFNEDPALDPVIRKIRLSNDGKNQPPSHCLPWVEAARYSIELKANYDYHLEKDGTTLHAWVDSEQGPIPHREIQIKIPEDLDFVPKDAGEVEHRQIPLSKTPAFSSPWQKKSGDSITLKMGICWWTPPGWGLFFGSAIHRNEEFRVVEGYVRTDLWHRDVPLVVQPLVAQVKIKKYSTIACLWLVPAEEIELVSFAGDRDRMKELVHNISMKRIRPHVYKEKVLKKRQPP